MKIIFLSRLLYLTGVSTHMRDLGSELVRMGHSVTILTAGSQFKDDEACRVLEKSIRDAGIIVETIPFPRTSKNSVFFYLQMIKPLWLTRSFLKRNKYDVIHVHTPSMSLVPKLLGYKFVSTTHIAKMELNRFSATEEIAVSKEIYDDLVKRRIPTEHISLINNGVSSSFIFSQKGGEGDKLPQGINCFSNLTRILFVGTLCYRKGLDILCKAVSNLPEKTKNKIQVIFIGDYDSLDSKIWLEGIIEDYDLKHIITVLGYRDPHKYYWASDIFVLPSRLEGFPLVSIEAMMGHCCLIMSNIEGADVQVIDGETGFVFQNENVIQLRNIIDRVVNSKDLQKKIADAGQEYAIEHFSSERMARQTIDVYYKVACNSNYCIS